jgi:hypothetical protein
MKLINTHVTKLQHNLTLIKKALPLVIRGNANSEQTDWWLNHIILVLAIDT